MENYHQHQKRKRDESPPIHSSSTFNGVDVGVDLSLLEAVEKSAQNGGVEVLDLRTLKKLVLAFERRLRDNLEARMKYPDQPEKFADSEVELHEEIERLRVLAGAPELYPELIALNTVPSLVGLLGHDNTDIAIDVVSLLMDLTDEDVLGDDEDNEEPARALVDAFLENNALELLVQNLARLSEADPDEATAIYNTLSTIENLIEVKPAVAELVCERTKLLRWLLGRIKVREFDANKQYASEILAILLQNSPANQKRLGQMNGVDAVLQAVAVYKSRDPKSEDEEEMLENLFDCLCCLLMPIENKERFMKSEGVELMIIIMKQKKSAYGSAIRALDFAMTKYPPACERFVDVLGLKTAFAAFMGGIVRGSRRERLLSKFVENECEKIDRLMELYMRYSDRVKAESERFEKLELDDLEIDEEERYNRKLDAGLYTLQLIAVILGHLWLTDHPRMRERIEMLLKQNRLTKMDVRDILQEYHDNIGDIDGPEEKERAQSKIQKSLFYVDAATFMLRINYLCFAQYAFGPASYAYVHIYVSYMRDIYLENYCKSTLQSEWEIILTIMSSRITSLLLPGGRTTYSRFTIYLNQEDDSTCNIIQGSSLADLLNPNINDHPFRFFGYLPGSGAAHLIMSGEEEENAAELKIGEEFLKAKCLMNCEVARILDHKYDQLQQISDDPTNQISQVFEKSMQYVKRFSRYKNPDAVRQVREVLSRYKLAEFELCVLGNLCPETVEEAIAIVPSIKRKGRMLEDDAIEKMLHDLSLIKKFE
ncbi:beta-catenin-like protein 1 [Canna indica]|uniref:ATP-dependent DNA helicase n=1 Tax=Canna indica TaxID=4628 RepID=A0AAQ3Q3L4_9LILI|nr:beta-catenin-like protein 1 [Canna indica]